MDKLQAWLRRIQQPPRREVANLDYWFLLAETRIAQEADLAPVYSGEDKCRKPGNKTSSQLTPG